MQNFQPDAPQANRSRRSPLRGAKTEKQRKTTCPGSLVSGLVPLSNAAKPPSRGNGLPVDDVCGLKNTEVKGGSAASEGGTEVPHSKVPKGG